MFPIPAASPTPWTIPILVALAYSCACERLQAADVLVGQNVEVVQRIPMQEVDHHVWDQLLQKYVDGQGLVDYASWKAANADLALLDRYLGNLSAARIRSDTDLAVQLAFWINAYNAVTIKGILREYPTSSIRNHTARLFGYNIWKQLKLQVDGRRFSLEQIEHDILRELDEPRIHFAIVCASLGCPKLRNTAYTSANVEQQLATNTREFFADTSKFQTEESASRVRLSPILKWFAEDFGKSQSERLRWIATVAPASARSVLTSPNVRVSYLGYDWGLNEQAGDN